MNPADMLRIVDSLHREKAIEKEIVFQAIEAALVTAAKKHYGELADIVVIIDRETGEISGTESGQPMDEAEISGRIGAQTAKQVIIQKIREAERDSLLGKFGAEIGTMITGVVTRNEGPATIVSFDGIESILPSSEQIPGETHHPNERVRAVIFEVKPQGSRLKVVLSRTRPQLVQRLFEQEIPEIADGVITIQAIAREPGHRSKVAVSSSDQRVDSVGACVGVRGNRIKNIVDELAGERIDIVRWSDDMQMLIPNALQPAEVDEVILCQLLGRAIVLVREDQLSLAIGRRGQNVRLGSKLCGWDIEIMTREELDESIERAVSSFSAMEGIVPEVAEALVGEGFLSYDDLSIIETDQLMEMGGLTEEQVETIRQQAEVKAAEAERLAAEQRRRDREQADREAAENEGRKVAALHAAELAAAGGANGASPAAEASGDHAAGDNAAGDHAAGHEPAQEESGAEPLATGAPAAGPEKGSEEGPSGETS